MPNRQGHDVVILDDLKNTSWRPPVLLIEWFRNYKFICANSAKLENCGLEVRI